MSRRGASAMVAAPAAMQVRVTLHGDLERYVPREPGVPAKRRHRREPFTCSLDDSATVAALVAHLGIPPETELVAGVNGALAARSMMLTEGDEVALLPPMRGGAPP